WFEAPPCYMYHTINAYEEDGEIVLTGCRIDNPLPPKGERRSDEGKPVTTLEILELVPFMHRWRFNLESGAVREEALHDVLPEFPTMNRAILGRKTRYSYNPRMAERPVLCFDGVIKYDVEASRSETYTYGPGRFGGEVAFAPRPGGAAEDDGWVLTFTYD